ncbi:MAG: hemerythrin domain-containing protein [Myxococcota bacterium]
MQITHHGPGPPDQHGDGRASARRVHAQHASIMVQVRQLTEALTRLADADQADPPGLAREIADRLARLGAELDRHFEDEEIAGFVRLAAEAAPRLTHRAEHIVGEHRGLRDTIGEVTRLASGRSPAWDEVSDRFGRFVGLLREHEGKEDELIQEALAEDLGGRG